MLLQKNFCTIAPRVQRQDLHDRGEGEQGRGKWEHERALKGRFPADCVQDSSRKFAYKLLGKHHLQIPPADLKAPQNTKYQTHTSPHHYAASFLHAISRVTVRASPSRQEVPAENKPRSNDKRETINLNISATFRKRKQRFLAAILVSYEIKRKHRRLRVLSQEGARSMEQLYPCKVRENLR